MARAIVVVTDTTHEVGMYERSSVCTDLPQEDVDMGYEDHRPSRRRGSMTASEEKQRRASIKAVLANEFLGPMEKRRSIQHLMDGRRHSIASTCMPISHADRYQPTIGYQREQDCLTYESMGYGYDDDIHDTKGDNCCGYKYCAEIQPSCSGDTKRLEQSRPPCNHYNRKCTLIAPCCGAAFGCRLCHDDCPILPPVIQRQHPIGRQGRSASMPSAYTPRCSPLLDDTAHTIDRFAVKEIICRECFTRQSSKTNNCVGCGAQFGEYHCSICNLWMCAEERPYHCADCGVCRVGGAENFKHCFGCGMCIGRVLFDRHNCKTVRGKLSHCPVCLKNLLGSRSATHEMPCGHSIHRDCFRQLAARDSRCPVCQKTAETRERMMPTWTARAQSVALQPVTPELANVVDITCIDCDTHADAQAWHFLGVQCPTCQSFNTVVDKVVMTGLEAYEFLEKQAFRKALKRAKAKGKRFPRIRLDRRRTAV